MSDPGSFEPPGRKPNGVEHCVARTDLLAVKESMVKIENAVGTIDGGGLKRQSRSALYRGTRLALRRNNVLIILRQLLQLLHGEDGAFFADVDGTGVAASTLAHAALHPVFETGVNRLRAHAELFQDG